MLTEMTPGRENAQRIALELLRAARSLGEATVAVESMGRHGWPEIEADGITADRIVIDGPDMARALRTLAVRLDRCALERFDEEIEKGSEYVLVPRVPTREMLDAAWADALAEDAAGVWAEMIGVAERLCP